MNSKSGSPRAALGSVILIRSVLRLTERTQALVRSFCYNDIMSHWSVYIVRCADKSLYTGITIDAATRVLIHNAGKGAKYTRSRRPVKLVYKKAMRSESAARKLEARIKTLSRAEKLDLVRGRSLDAWHKT